MNFVNSRFEAAPGEQANLLTPGELTLSALRSAARYRRTIIVFAVVFVALAVGYLAITPKEYLAVAEMLIDPRKSEEAVPTKGGSQQPDSPVDPSVVESEGAVLQSENVVRAVIKNLNLLSSPTFTDPRGLFPLLTSLANSALGHFITRKPQTDYEVWRATVEDFKKRLTVKREGVTYVFEIDFLSPDPQEAAAVANAVATAYVNDLLQAKYAARSSASAWMQERLKALSEQATKAEAAAAEFKRTHGIVSTGGRLMDEQQVSELESQLTIAKTTEANDKAKVDRIQDILAKRTLDLSVADALSNQVIISLRDSYVDLSKREAALEARLGRDHEAPRLLRADMEHVKASIFDELERIGQGYQSDLKIATDQVGGITAQLERAVSHSGDTAAAQVQADQLDSDARAYRALYDTFLQHFGEVVQEQSSPVTESRLVTEATPPVKKSKPKSALILLGMAIAGSGLGFCVGWMRDKSNRNLRTSDQVEFGVEAPVLASVPRLPQNKQGAISRETVREPFSLFTESIRDLRVFLEFQRNDHAIQAIGFTSSVPGEGKSAIVPNLAALMAKSRGRVLVIDADARTRSLTMALGAEGKCGLVEVLTGEANVADAIVTDEVGGFDFLPASDASYKLAERLSHSDLRELVASLKAQYEYILIDLPPILAVTDAKAAASALDGFIIVSEWNRTTIDMLSEAVRASSYIKTRLLGIILNKVAPSSLSRYRGAYGSRYLVASQD